MAATKVFMLRIPNVAISTRHLCGTGCCNHAVYRILYPFFDTTFIADSFSCRDNKGTHRAINRFRTLSRSVSEHNTKTCWVLKCDIRKFFASIDHKILLSILQEYILDQDIICLLQNIIESFETPRPHPALSSRRGNRDSFSCEEKVGMMSGVGLPLGNLTSQLFANVYMNRFDQWVKHKIKAKYYIRYADDFVFLSHDKSLLEKIIPQIQEFLQTNFKLSLHPNKLFLHTISSGMDFLGWVNFSDHRILRAITKRRMFARIKVHPTKETLQSYLGMLGHGNAKKLTDDLLTEYLLWKK